MKISFKDKIELDIYVLTPRQVTKIQERRNPVDIIELS